MNSLQPPTVSVIMGIYNCAKTLPEAIDSIIDQTYQDFELILCNDGSTDETFSIAQDYAIRYPEHIVLIQNDKNMGLNFTLNHCLKTARGKYIARMDGDDRSLPLRFEKEVAFLDNHPEIAFVSTAIDVFDSSGVWGERYFPQHPKKKDFAFEAQFSHSACMIRKEAYDAVGGYTVSPWLLRVEDCHLWIKLYAAGFQGANLPEKLYAYRDDKDSYHKRKYKDRVNAAYVTCYAVKNLNLPIYLYCLSLKPLVVGLLPYGIYKFFHNKKLSRSDGIAR